MLLAASALTYRYTLSEVSTLVAWSVYLSVLHVYIVYVCTHCYVATKVILLLYGVATTSGVPASLMMGDQPPLHS